MTLCLVTLTGEAMKISRMQLRKLIIETLTETESEVSTFKKAQEYSKNNPDEQVNYYDPDDELVQILKKGVVDDTVKAPVGTKAYKNLAFDRSGVKTFGFGEA